MGKLDELKEKRDCPCVTEKLNRKGEKVRSVPSVLCDYDCGRCGWNPEEVQRRLATGKFVVETKTLPLRDDDGEIVDTITGTVKTLHFRSAR